ncbi:MAG: hypothetical protein ABSH36_01600 [Solirubrobacteraceae bacterium]
MSTTTPSKRAGSCGRCHTQGYICPACAARLRHRALALHQKGLSPHEIAGHLNVTLPQTRRLIEEAEQLRDLQQYKRDLIPVAPIRELFERRLEEDPTLNQIRVAAKAQTDRIELRRALGMQPTASRLIRGERRPGKTRTEITVEMASRIVKALGVAPHEIPWL